LHDLTCQCLDSDNFMKTIGLILETRYSDENIVHWIYWTQQMCAFWAVSVKNSNKNKKIQSVTSLAYRETFLDLIYDKISFIFMENGLELIISLSCNCFYTQICFVLLVARGNPYFKNTPTSSLSCHVTKHRKAMLPSVVWNVYNLLWTKIRIAGPCGACTENYW